MLKSSQITLNNKDLFLTELLERVKKYFESVGFDINETGDKDFEATYKGITYLVYLKEDLYVKRGNIECYTFKAMPAPRQMNFPKKQVENSYLKKDIEKLYNDLSKLQGDIISMENNELSHWFVEKDKEIYFIDDVLKEIFS